MNSLKSINISDCDIGGMGIKKIVRALGSSKSRDTIESFSCNYNDVERTKTAQYIFNIFRLCKNLTHVSFVGNMIKGQLKKQYKDEFEQHDKTLVLRDETEEGEEEEEMDEDEELSEDEEEGEDSEQETDEAKELEKQFEALKLD